MGAPKGSQNALKYKPIFAKRVKKYLDSCVDEQVDFVRQESVSAKKDGTEKKYLMYGRKLKVNLPSIEGFAIFLKVSRITMYAWEETYPDFAKSLDKIRVEQQKRLVNYGLSGDYNPAIASLMLSSNHNMKKRVDNTTGDKPLENNFTDEQADRIAKRIIEGRNSSIDSPAISEESD